jgi:NDP-sugar pyrophosphorylase family protein
LSWIGLIMAGGDGTRMVQSGIHVRKPLVSVVGVTLLERNLWMLANAGCRHIVIATSSRAAASEKSFTDDLARRAASIGIVVELLVEDKPLGNFGAVSRLSGRGKPVVIVFADNLTSLDLSEIVAAHNQSKSALTLAAHIEPFRMPYGELRLRSDVDSQLEAYVEKPSYDILVSSAIAVISVEALELVPRESAIGISNVANIFIAAGLPISVYRHASLWIDVNDSASLCAAQLLVRRNQELFERWWEGRLLCEGVLTLAQANGFLKPSKWFAGAAMVPSQNELISTFDVLTSNGVVRVHATLTDVGASGGTSLPPSLTLPVAARLEAMANLV